MSAQDDRENPVRRLASVPLPGSAVGNPRAERAASSLEDRAALAEIKSDLASIHSQLGQINSAIISIQTHSLRQTGGVALTLSVLIVISWKLIGG